METLLGRPVHVLDETSESGKFYILNEILFTRLDGNTTADTIMLITHYGEKIITSHGLLRAFHDWRKVTSYESDCRSILVNYSKEKGEKNPENNILLTQGIVSMGVSVASLVLNNLHVFTDETKFMDKLKEALTKSIAQNLPQSNKAS